MRIVFLSYHYSPDISSPQDWLERIDYYIGWPQWLAKNHTIIRVDQINYEGTYFHQGIQYYFVNDGKRKNYFPWKLNRFVKNLMPDLVVISSLQFPLQVMQLRIYLGNSIKIFLQHHAEKPFSGIRKWIQHIGNRGADAFLFTSFETGASWVKSNNLDAINKIRELQEVSSFFYPTGQTEAREITKVNGSPAFIWVGRLDKNKDPLTAIRAFLLFTEINPRAKLYMIFQTIELLEEIKKLILVNPAESSIILIGNIQHKDVLYWLNSTDFYLSASHYEGSGTALCEAMSCGCIPIVTAIPSFKKIVGENGFFFEPGNAMSLLSVLEKSMQINPEEMKRKVLDHFKTELSFQSIAEKFQQLINSCN